MQYTESEDGVKRTTIRVPVCLTYDQVEEARRLAVKHKMPLRDFLECAADEGVEWYLLGTDGSYDQRTGRGA